MMQTVEVRYEMPDGTVTNASETFDRGSDDEDRGYRIDEDGDFHFFQHVDFGGGEVHRLTTLYVPSHRVIDVKTKIQTVPEEDGANR